MDKCEMFVCRFLSSCLVGVDCENGVAPNCRLNFCEICQLQKRCKLKVHKQNIISTHSVET